MNASLKIILFSICLFTFASVGASDSKGIEDEMVELISTGNTSRLRTYFNSRLQISIENESSIVSSQQAYTIINDFFNLHTPQKFKVTLNGGKDQNRYLSGILLTSSGAFNVTVYYTLTVNGKKEIIQQIRIKKHEGQLRLGDTADKFSS